MGRLHRCNRQGLHISGLRTAFRSWSLVLRVSSRSTLHERPKARSHERRNNRSHNSCSYSSCTYSCIKLCHHCYKLNCNLGCSSERRACTSCLLNSSLNFPVVQITD